MLRVSINWIELAVEAIKNQRNILVINFFFLSEVNASDPLVLYFLEGRLDFHDDGQLVEHVPEDLKFTVEVPVFGGLGDVVEGFEFCVYLLNFAPFFALLEGVEFLFSCFGVGFFWGHE